MSLAGAGRAGTFASLEIAHTFLHNTKPKRLNINDCIQKVREGRLHSLQTMHQYKFIYIVLIDHIMSCKVSIYLFLSTMVKHYLFTEITRRFTRRYC